ncbi:hypothetical protein ACPTHL_30395, partial [Pseudomonas aeruginosa]|uniref:hypothetical protein n=1 Tax=Pseudomonas aeruginosa TaxID=287 RepID=UPI003CC59332
PTVVRDSDGLEALSGKKYRDNRVIDGTPGPEGRPSILPTNANQMFDGQAVDLRELKTEKRRHTVKAATYEKKALLLS